VLLPLGIAAGNSLDNYLSGTTNAEQAKTIAIDNNNDYITASLGSSNFTLTKRDQNANIVWQTGFTLAASSSPPYVWVDSANNIYVVRPDSSSVSYLFKFDSDGVLTWQKQLAASALNVSLKYGLTTSSGDIYLCGSIDNKALLMKLDSSGSITWQRRLDATDYRDITSIAVDSSENVYGLGDGRIVKLNSSGVRQFAFIYDSGVWIWGGMKLDSTNALLATWNQADNSFQVFARIRASDGVVLTGRKITTTSTNNTTIPFGFDVDSSNNFYVGWSVTGGLGAIVKYNSSLNIQTQRTLTTNINALEVDSENQLVVCNYLGLSTHNDNLSRLPSDGSKTGEYSFGTATVEYATSTYTEEAYTINSTSFTPTVTTITSITATNSSFSPVARTFTDLVVEI
jgi:hypothetical protein